MIYVHKGPAAIREGRYWRGYCSGHLPCTQRRITAERALRDARHAQPQSAEQK